MECVHLSTPLHPFFFTFSNRFPQPTCAAASAADSCSSIGSGYMVAGALTSISWRGSSTHQKLSVPGGSSRGAARGSSSGWPPGSSSSKLSSLSCDVQVYSNSACKVQQPASMAA